MTHTIHMHMGVVECAFADVVNVTYFTPTARDGTGGISQRRNSLNKLSIK